MLQVYSVDNVLSNFDIPYFQGQTELKVTKKLFNNENEEPSPSTTATKGLLLAMHETLFGSWVTGFGAWLGTKEESPISRHYNF